MPRDKGDIGAPNNPKLLKIIPVIICPETTNTKNALIPILGTKYEEPSTINALKTPALNNHKGKDGIVEKSSVLLPDISDINIEETKAIPKNGTLANGADLRIFAV